MAQKQQATTAASKPLGMCEKLFSAFQPGLRPLRRLTFRQQEETTASPADSSPAQAHHGPIPQSKLPEPVAPPPPQGKSKLPKVQHNPKPKHQEKPLPTPVRPEAEVRPLVPVPQPLPPPPPLPPKAEAHKPRKGFNDKVDDYIRSTKAKMRITSMKAGQPASDTPRS